MPSPLRYLLPAMLVLALASPGRAQVDDEAQLKANSVATDGTGLLSFFKKRTLGEDTRAKVGGLVRQLGADDYASREQATNDLEDLGGLVRAQLSQALRDSDPEVRRRARRVLTKLGPAAAENNLYATAARVLAVKKPAGAAEVLLNFLPCVEDVDVAEEVARSLAPLTMSKEGKVDPAVTAALSDKFPIKRYSAAEALITVGGAANRPAVRKLLADTDSGVRRRVAVSLVMARDKTAVPVLLELLNSRSSEDADAAEDTLALLAGESAPVPPDTDSAVARTRYVKSWENWWKDRGDKFDIAKADMTGTGRYTLVTMLSNGRVLGKGRNNGVVLEMDNNGKKRWEITDLGYPVHVSKHRRDRVLICEYYNNRVTERDLTTSKIYFEKTVGGQIVSAERLNNGNTFIVTRYQILEINSKGADVYSISRPAGDCLSAKKTKDGKIMLVSSNGICAKLDTTGKQISQFNVGYLNAPVGFNAHFLPRGGVIVPDYNNSKVREYDASGKMIWEATVQYPNSAVRLSSGNTLVATRSGNFIIELDKTGKEVAKRNIEGVPLFIDRR